MLLWIIAAVIIAIACTVGYYQGAVRGAFSTLGLIIAAALAMPLSAVTTPILRIFKLEHPVLLAIFAPILAYLLILIIFKVGGFVVHRKLQTYYKYHDSDTHRLLYERLTERLGICFGVINGVIYVVLLSVVAYVLGYATTQFAVTSDAPFVYRALNALASAVQSSGMTKAIASYDPAPPEYYLGSDILADFYHTPLLQRRVSTYPPLLMFAQRPEFQEIAKDAEFQETWARQPSLSTFTSHARIKPLLQNVELYNEAVGLVKKDLPDMKEYLATGISPKYQDEQILGRWKFDMGATLRRAKDLNQLPTTLAQRRAFVSVLRATMTDAQLTATIEKGIVLKTSAGDEAGKWERTETGKYLMTTSKGTVEATVDGRRLLFKASNIPMVFKKT